MVRERNPSQPSTTQDFTPQKSERLPLANIGAKMQSSSGQRAKEQSSEQSKERSKEQSRDVDNDVSWIMDQPPAQFGKASPLRNPLHAHQQTYNPLRGPPRKQPTNPFIERKTVPNNAAQRQPYPVLPQSASSQSHAGDSSERKRFYLPGQAPAASSASQPDAALVRLQQEMNRPYQTSFEIPVPTNRPVFSTQPASRPIFSSLGPNPSQVYAKPPKQVIDLTNQSQHEDDEDEFDPDAAIKASGNKFGAADPYMYVDSGRANENIKHLLEGAFDDENDKSKTRLRNRVKKTAAEKSKDSEAKSLSDKLSQLAVTQKEKASQFEGQTQPDKLEEDEEEEEEDGTVDGLTVKLLPHQVEGVSWMIDKEAGKRKNGVLPHGGILADDMGLGKTVQSVALILLNPRPPLDAKKEYPKQRLPGKEVDKCTLVVAPLALIRQWEGEIKNKVARSHALKVLVHHGPNRTKSAAELKKYDVVVTTYSILTSEHAGSNMLQPGGARIGCFGVHWYRIILDEAHSIKNRNAKASLACCALESWNRWCLTGTPMQNSLDELQALIKFLRIRPYCDLTKWKDDITKPMKAGRGGLAMTRLHHYLNTFMKRRTKDILKKEGALNFGGKADNDKKGGMKIVKRDVMTVDCRFDSEEQEFYDRLQDRAQSRINEMVDGGGKADYIGALVLLLRLRQACNHPHLIAAAIDKDRDAMTTGGASISGSQTPGKSSQVVDGEMDDLNALMAGVSVRSTSCEVCGVKLSDEEARQNQVHCKECKHALSPGAGLQKEKRKQDVPKTLRHAQRNQNRRVLIDSDDENDEGEGEWVAKGKEQHLNLGKAGGTDDEDAEGGGDTLGASDSDTDDSDQEDRSDSSASERNGDSDGDSDSNSPVLAGLTPSNKSKHKSSTKIRQVLRILRTETPKHKVIVFSQFTSMLDLLQPHVKQRLARYDGSMRPDAREAALNALRNDPKTRVLLCSLKCGSLGLNLTAASRVIIVEPFWNPFVEEQAIDRVHRLNQTVDVKVFRLTILGSVEERIFALQERKRELAAAALDGGKAVGKLSMADIMSLFKSDNHQTAEMSEMDRRFAEKFGEDTRLIDGEVGSPSGMGQQIRGQLHDPRRKEGRSRNGAEHQVYGRRW